MPESYQGMQESEPTENQCGLNEAEGRRISGIRGGERVWGQITPCFLKKEEAKRKVGVGR